MSSMRLSQTLVEKVDKLQQNLDTKVVQLETQLRVVEDSANKQINELKGEFEVEIDKMEQYPRRRGFWPMHFWP